jgi:hypothetical protein
VKSTCYNKEEKPTTSQIWENGEKQNKCFAHSYDNIPIEWNAKNIK